jgi:hypothetical protein
VTEIYSLPARLSLYSKVVRENRAYKQTIKLRRVRGREMGLLSRNNNMDGCFNNRYKSSDAVDKLIHCKLYAENKCSNLMI